MSTRWFVGTAREMLDLAMTLFLFLVMFMVNPPPTLFGRRGGGGQEQRSRRE